MNKVKLKLMGKGKVEEFVEDMTDRYEPCIIFDFQVEKIAQTQLNLDKQALVDAGIEVE